MLGTPFYHSTIRKITVALGTLINDIHLIQKDANGNQIKDTKVPVSYGPRQGYWAMAHERSETPTDTYYQKNLPRISFNLDSLDYDPERQLNPLNVSWNIGSPAGNNFVRKQFERVPYNFNFSIAIFVKNVEDGLQILEQILPFFSPQYNLTIIDIPEMDIRTDVPVILDSISQNDNFTEGLTTNRLISWELRFVVKGYIYPPVKDSAIIKKVFTHVYEEPSMTTQLEQIGIEVNPLTAQKGDPYTAQKTIT